MEYKVSSLNEFNFSSVAENTEIIRGTDGKKGIIIGFAAHELYPAFIIEWEDKVMTTPYHFDCQDLFLIKDM